jgi:hypothetical protein
MGRPRKSDEEVLRARERKLTHDRDYQARRRAAPKLAAIEAGRPARGPGAPRDERADTMALWLEVARRAGHPTKQLAEALDGEPAGRPGLKPDTLGKAIRRAKGQRRKGAHRPGHN